MNTHARFARFLVVGTLGFGADASLTVWLSSGLAVSPLVARAGGFALASLLTYMFNRSWTFADGYRRDRGYVAYVATTGIGALANYGVFALIVQRWGAAPEVVLAGTAAGSLLGLIVNYAIANRLIFPAQRIDAKGASR